MFLQMALFHFYGWVVFYCVCVYIYTYAPHFLYPFFCWWMFKLFPYLGYFKYCCDDHWGVYSFSNQSFLQIYAYECFPSGSDGKESACSVRDPGLISGLGRSPGEGNSNPLQSSCLENPMDGGAWQVTDHRVTKSQTQLRAFTFFLSCLGVGLLDHMIALFLVFWGTTILFSIVAYTNLHSHQQCNRVSFFPVMDFLTGDKWYLIMDLICIYLIIIKSNVEHLFMCLLDICMSSLKKSLFSKGLLLPIFWLNFFLYWVI